MSVFENSSNKAQETHASRTPRVTVAQLFLRALRRWQRNRAIDELSRLSDAQLQDIGISRNDIPRVVYGHLDSEPVQPNAAPSLSTPEDRMRMAA